MKLLILFSLCSSVLADFRILAPRPDKTKTYDFVDSEVSSISLQMKKGRGGREGGGKGGSSKLLLKSSAASS